MSPSHHSKFLDDPEFQSLLVACLESMQRGEMIDRVALAKDFPKYASELGQFLDDRKVLEEVAADLEDVQPNPGITSYEATIASNSEAEDPIVSDKIRYIGEYEILEEIARGGMGIVFKARQQSLKRVVALKMILAGRLADLADIERFQREARAAGRLKHPNIVPVHEIGEYEGRHYFTMDFVEGRSLSQEIREETLPPRHAARLVQQCADAVHYAHQQGTVHRDLKPANILLTQEMTPKITDFGLAKLLDAVDEESRAELTASGQILGTPSYMSPEQAAGKQNLVGPSTDIYSLGAILYACLTGRAPFVADSPVDTLLHVMNQEPLSPRVLNPSVPKDLETICLKCLQKEPHKRYGTAEELSEDLQRFLEGRPVMARPISVINKSISWCRRNKTIASLLMLLFTSMAIGTLIASKFAVDARQHAKDEQLQRLQAEAAQHAAEQAHKEAERAKSDVLRSLYIARIYLTRLLWDRGNKWGASLPHLQQFFKNDLMIADPDPKIELQTLNQMITANPSDDFLHFLRGIYYAKRRQWQESIADLELSSNLISQQYWYHCEAASVALMVDDYETYDYHVQSLLKYLKEFEKEGEILSGANISLIATLRPQSPEVLSRLLPFTKSWSSSQSNQFYRMKSLILVRLRMGEYVTVLKLLEPFQAELSFRRKEHEVLAGSIRALAFYHLGHINEAKQILHLAQKTYDDQLTKGFEVSNGSLQDTHHPFIQAHILLNEAKLNIENNQTNVNGGDVPNQFDLQEQIQELMRKLHLIQQSELLLLKENPFFSQGHRAVENDFERTHFDVTEFEATSQVNIQLVQNQLDSKDETVRIKALEKLVALK